MLTALFYYVEESDFLTKCLQYKKVSIKHRIAAHELYDQFDNVGHSTFKEPRVFVYRTAHVWCVLPNQDFWNDGTGDSLQNRSNDLSVSLYTFQMTSIY